MAFLGPLLAELVALAFPARCGACSAPISAHDRGLCTSCAAELLSLAEIGYCNKCGQDAGPFALKPTSSPGVGVCGLCDSRLYRYSSIVRVGPYVEPLDGMIRKFKYNNCHHLAGMFGQWQSSRMLSQPWIEQIDACVPVPLHWRRRLGRGFNQSELLAEVVAGRLGRPMIHALSRPVARPPQASLPRSKRFENVRGVFSVSKAKWIRGRRLCLVDDVCTTGATLSEAARTLLAGGAVDVVAVVVAVAQPAPAYSKMPNDPI